MMNSSSQPVAGDHVVTLRWCGPFPFTHHGIYMGDETVVHYSGMPGNRCPGVVEEVSLREFRGNRLSWVRHYTDQPFDRQRIMQRARSRLNENKYDTLANNCEHFAQWCVTGRAESSQAKLAATTVALAATVSVGFALRQILRNERGFA